MIDVGLFDPISVIVDLSSDAHHPDHQRADPAVEKDSVSTSAIVCLKSISYNS